MIQKKCMELIVSIGLPGNISNIENIKLMAFITNTTGSIVNVQQAKVGTTKDFERL